MEYQKLVIYFILISKVIGHTTITPLWNILLISTHYHYIIISRVEITNTYFFISLGYLTLIIIIIILVQCGSLTNTTLALPL